jgi:hypothetical protein
MLQASMYFAYAGKQRPGIRARTTFEAILLGERTGTTRFPCWPGHARWLAAEPGDRIRFFADRDMRGEHIDVIVESKRIIDPGRRPGIRAALRCGPADPLPQGGRLRRQTRERCAPLARC